MQAMANGFQELNPYTATPYSSQVADVTVGDLFIQEEGTPASNFHQPYAYASHVHSRAESEASSINGDNAPIGRRVAESKRAKKEGDLKKITGRPMTDTERKEWRKMKNREAARKCRATKEDRIKRAEGEVSQLKSENKQLLIMNDEKDRQIKRLHFLIEQHSIKCPSGTKDCQEEFPGVPWTSNNAHLTQTNQTITTRNHIHQQAQAEQALQAPPTYPSTTVVSEMPAHHPYYQAQLQARRSFPTQLPAPVATPVYDNYGAGSCMSTPVYSNFELPPRSMIPPSSNEASFAASPARFELTTAAATKLERNAAVLAKAEPPSPRRKGSLKRAAVTPLTLVASNKNAPSQVTKFIEQQSPPRRSPRLALKRPIENMENGPITKDMISILEECEAQRTPGKNFFFNTKNLLQTPGKVAQSPVTRSQSKLAMDGSMFTF